MPSPYPEPGRPADPSEEVDQGGALEAEGAAARLADTAREPPEFVVCALMREIRAFRYFWPFGMRLATLLA
jgi:hypothetical protein